MCRGYVTNLITGATQEMFFKRKIDRYIYIHTCILLLYGLAQTMQSIKCDGNYKELICLILSVEIWEVDQFIEKYY